MDEIRTLTPYEMNGREWDARASLRVGGSST